MFGWMFPKVKKHEFEQHKSAVQTALNSVKQDFSNVSKLIKHLDTQDEGLKKEVKGLGEELNYIRQELEEIKNLLGEKMEEKEEENVEVFKQRQTTKHKQTAVYGVQTAVQTAVQAAFLDKLSISEKAIIMILANSDLKLSYEDLGVMTGKDSTTIRGQINTIKQKCPGVIEEQIERNNKKRLFIPEKIRGILLRKAKVRQKKPKNEEIEVEIE